MASFFIDSLICVPGFLNGADARTFSVFMNQEWVDTIRDTAAEAEHLGDLHPDQLRIIYGRRWFKIFIPVKYGGLGYSLPDALKLQESLSRVDGSTGWVVTLCGGAGWFAGFLQDPLREEFFSDAGVCIAGSGAATGTAEVVDGGYKVTGYWKYASGCLHATAFTANCVIHKDGLTQYNVDGRPLVRTFLFKKEEVALHRNWHGMGMIATASHSFSVRALFVPVDRCFIIDPTHAVMIDPVYQYPFLQLAETTLSVNLSGMAMRFLDLCQPIFLEKTKRGADSGMGKLPDLLQPLDEAKVEMGKWRLAFYAAADASWRACVEGMTLPEDVLKAVSTASYSLARASRELVDNLYPYCGLRAADRTEEINRVWRNFHTATQHGLFASAWRDQ